jgi:hypothetical protein
VAPIPDEKTSAASVRSSTASFASTLTTVGFVYREYRNLAERPSLYATTSCALSNTNVVVS